ncbi:MAG: hypothetical protein Q9227_000538 [Pyrenula ochraceoflavens]
MAHYAANVAFQADASQRPKFREGQPRNAPVRARSYDHNGSASPQFSNGPSNVQRLSHGYESVGESVDHGFGTRWPKTTDNQQVVRNTQQSSGPPPVPPKEPIPSASDHHQGALHTIEDDEDQSVADDDAVNPTDLFYVVMGVTGAGKSSFISLLSEDAAEVGHDLESKTKHVSIHKFRSPDGRKAWLLDTPGFDDTGRPNVEILTEIIASLTKLQEHGAYVSGMIYLHRITDTRMSGSALKTLQIFKLLTGLSAMPIVRLVTTRWNEVDSNGPDREKADRLYNQLRTSDKFWGEMIRDGAVSLPHDGTPASARAIALSLLEREQPPPKLAIVRELLDDKLSLLDTATGKFVSHDNAELRKQYEAEIQKLQQEQKQATEEKDHEAAELFAAEETEYQRRIEQLRNTESQFNVNSERLQDRSSSTDRGNLEGLESENNLLHLQQIQLEDKFAEAERQHRIEIAKLKDAMARENKQEQERAMHELKGHYKFERRQLEDELYNLKRRLKKNRKLRKPSIRVGDLLPF